MGRIYLDHNATAALRPEVLEAMVEVLRGVGNPSSVHGFGRAARNLVEDARERVARLVGARPADVVFTAGGTEANNLALKGAPAAAILASAIEHPSVLNAAPDARRVPVTADGIVDLAALERMLAAARKPALVALMLANNETGVIQPVAEAARIAQAHGAKLHCDAVQAAGKVAVDVVALGADTLSVSAHKLGGPQGVGALIVREGARLAPLIAGGGQEHGLRAGTENVAGIVGFGVAADSALNELDAYARIATLRDHMERSLGARVFGAAAPRLPNTSQLAMPDVAAETQVIAFDLDGIAVSAGSACSSGKVGPPYVLLAMGVPEREAGTAIRVSLGRDTTPDEIERFIAAWRALRGRTHKVAAA
jgi:cysteine desulfurase